MPLTGERNAAVTAPGTRRLGGGTMALRDVAEPPQRSGLDLDARVPGQALQQGPGTTDRVRHIALAETGHEVGDAGSAAGDEVAVGGDVTGAPDALDEPRCGGRLTACSTWQ